MINWGLTAMSPRQRLLVKLIAAHAALFGASAMCAAWAENITPIDTSITVQAPAKSRHALKTPAGKNSKVAHPSGVSADRKASARAAKHVVVRNAIGQPVHQTSADIRGTDVKASERVGVVAAPNNGAPSGKGGIKAVKTDFHSQGFVPLRTSVIAPHDPQINTATNHSIINGRDMVRPGLGAGVVGGPTKNVAGVINGTGYRPRHP